jgi:hypothetical protein
MKLNKLILIAMLGVCAAFLVASGISASSNGLRETTNTTVVDGVIEPNEYSYSHEFKESTLYLNWNSGKVYIAFVAETKGWVGVGFGSTMMNNSHIHIGYVDNGNPVFKEQVGKGKTHTDTDTTYVQSFEMSEEKDDTTLELVFNESDIIQGGQQKIDFIIAYGKKDSFTQYHSGTREGFSVDIVK